MADAGGGHELGAWGSFTRDLGSSLRAWAKAPMLPVLSVAIGAAEAILNARRMHVPGDFLLLFGFQLLFAGWVGTQRIWYLRTWRGKGMAASEVFTFTGKFLWRFVWLGLIVVGLMIPFTIFAFVLARSTTSPAVVMSVLAVAVDFILTFVTPALAFSTARAGDAMGIGVRTLRETWPRCAWYALVPPLAIAAAGSLLPDSVLSTSARVTYLAATALVALLFKGAAAAFYLRHHEVGDDGSVHMRYREGARDSSAVPVQPERPR